MIPCLVGDCFAGSGTVLTVAKKLGRDHVGIELNHGKYGPEIELRLAEVGAELRAKREPNVKEIGKMIRELRKGPERAA